YLYVYLILILLLWHQRRSKKVRAFEKRGKRRFFVRPKKLRKKGLYHNPLKFANLGYGNYFGYPEVLASRDIYLRRSGAFAVYRKVLAIG
ncbi:MAG: hypothetical protein SO119_05485, partial [Phascolarctobacterium sp.]|nr:hypothetical protein [Phascolarctobacterium sp.]